MKLARSGLRDLKFIRLQQLEELLPGLALINRNLLVTQLVPADGDSLKQRLNLWQRKIDALRLHANSDPESEPADIITKTAGRGGIVLMLSFAVGRAPKMPVYLGDKSHRDLFPAS